MSTIEFAESAGATVTVEFWVFENTGLGPVTLPVSASSVRDLRKLVKTPKICAQFIDEWGWRDFSGVTWLKPENCQLSTADWDAPLSAFLTKPSAAVDADAPPTNTVTFILKPPASAPSAAGPGVPDGRVGAESESSKYCQSCIDNSGWGRRRCFADRYQRIMLSPTRLVTARHWSRSITREVPLQNSWDDFVFAVQYGLSIPLEGRVYWIINGETWADHKHELNDEGSYKLMFPHALAGKIQIWATDLDVSPTTTPTSASKRVDLVANTPRKASDSVSVPTESMAFTIADSFDSRRSSANQRVFREGIIVRHKAHGKLQCVFCGHPSDHGEGLEACHIVEVHSKRALRRTLEVYSVFDTYNGLPCCPLCHDLFDIYLLSIGSDYNIIVSEALQFDSVYGDKYRPLHGTPAKYRFDLLDRFYPPMRLLEYRVQRQQEIQAIRENDRRTTDKVFACKKCNKRYKTIPGLSGHMRDGDCTPTTATLFHRVDEEDALEVAESDSEDATSHYCTASTIIADGPYRQS